MNILLEPFQYDFFLRALILGGLMAVVCSLVGIFVVMRREALMSHALAHSAFLGVTLGLLLGVQVEWTMYVMTMIVALGISYLQHWRGISSDSLLEFIAQLSFALAVVVMTLLQGYRVDLFQYLFGDILAISAQDMYVYIPLLLGIVVVTLSMKRFFLQAVLSRELAVSQHVPLWLLNTLFVLFVALLVSIGIKMIGVILISAFLILPANTGRLFSPSFRSLQWWTVGTALVGTIGGLFLSYYANVPSGASIVLVLSALLLLGFLFMRVRKKVT